jgi:hypothetical protein
MQAVSYYKTKMKIYFNGCPKEPTHIYSDIDPLSLNVMQFLGAVTVLSLCFSWLCMSSQVFMTAL